MGYLGSVSDLEVIDGSRPTPEGTSWDRHGFLYVHADSLALDHVYVRGGVYFTGAGTLTITNSIIEGGYGTWFVVVGITRNSTLAVSDSTLRWRPGSTPGRDSGIGAIQILESLKIIALRNDISGTPDGIQVAGDGSRIERNWIHDLALLGTYPNNTHNDGIQVYDGEDISISRNRIEIGFDGVHQNAAIFLAPGEGNTIGRVRVTGNYLQGGGYTLRLERTTTHAVVRDNTFGLLPTAFGHSYALEGATIAEWVGNKDTTNRPVGNPGGPQR